MAASFAKQVYEVVKRIPAGKVASYGQIAKLLGRPRAAREVGWALRDTPDGMGIPWQRVMNAKGRISFPVDSQAAALQRAMLEDEGVEFRLDGSVDLKVYGWQGLDLGEQREILGEEPADDGPQMRMEL